MVAHVTSKRMILLAAGGLVALVLSAGCSSSDSADEHTGHAMTASASATASAPGAQSRNDADVAFAQHMIPHHQQAVEMSDILLGKQGVDPRVSELATQIKSEQGPEIDQMQQWLTEWGTPAMPDHGDMPGMPAMQGMVSEQDLTTLRNTTGADAARLYLTQMIAHHEGAIAMAQTEIKDGQYPAAVELARTIVSAQTSEIDTMKKIQASL
jgi:uncharacterized protein (DUF305 family)